MAFAAALAVAVWAAASEPEAVDVAPAMREAEAWLELVDRGAYGASWERAAQPVREAMPRVQWEVTLQGLRSKLGNVIRRKLRSATYARDPPGAPPGEYVVIQYDTTYENRVLSVETITPVRQKDGAWRVSGYFIR
jgi:hypothetical protein